MNPNELLDPSFLTDEVEEPAIPVEKINVINPQGEAGSVNLDWFLSKGIQNGFKLSGSPDFDGPSDLDFDGSDKLKVVKRSDGVEGTVNKDWFLNNPDASKEFVLKSKYDPEFESKIKQDLDDLNKKHLFENVEDSPITARHKLDEIQDKDGNYKLIGPDGKPVLVSSKNISNLVGKLGFKFQDKSAQALYEAYRLKDYYDKKGDGASSIADKAFSTVSGAAQSIPGVKSILKSSYLDDKYANIMHKMDLINQDIKDSDSSYYKAGQVLGTAAQIISPTGIFGEMKAGQAAKAALLGKLAPEGASLGRALIAKGIAGAVEGAIISAPQTIAQIALDEDPKTASESLGIGLGVGFALGIIPPGLRALGQGAKKIGSEALERGKSVYQWAADRKLLSKTTSGSVTQALEKEAMKAPGTALDMVSPMVGESGIINAAQKQIDNVFIDSLKAKGLTKKSSIDDVQKIFQELAEGEQIGSSVMSRLEDLHSKLPANEKQNLLTFVLDVFENAEQRGISKLGYKLDDEIIAKAAKMPDKISISGLRNFVKDIGKEINWKKIDSSAKDQTKALFWGHALTQFDNVVDGLVKTSQDPKLIESWVKEGGVMKKALEEFNSIIKSPASAVEVNPWLSKVMGLASNKITGAVAGSVGGPIGSVIGAGASGLADEAVKGAEAAIIQYAQNSGSKNAGWLVKNKYSNAVGSLAIIDSIKTTADKISEISGFLKNIKDPSGQIVKAYSLSNQKDPIKEILGPEVNGLSKAQQFNRLSDKVAMMASSPATLKQNFDLYIGPLFQDHPQLTKQLFNDYQKKIQVMNKIVNAYNNKEPAAFQGKDKKFTPTQAQMAEMESLLRVANNPYALLDGLKNGKVTAKQVAVANDVNPAIVQKIREELTKEAYSGKSKLSYQQRLSASIIMGAPMDRSIKNGAALQAAYGGEQNPPAPAGASNPRPKKQGNSKSLKPKSFASYTASQRISNL